MTEYTLNIGDVVTSLDPANYTCYGLGSCIGLFIHDRTTGISGGAHILLPECEEGPDDANKFYNVVTALDELLYQFRLQGANLNTLRAKITGGANVIDANTKAGWRNTESALNRLVENKIFIAAVDVGGNHCRTAKFYGHTGQLKVSTGNNECKVY